MNRQTLPTFDDPPRCPYRGKGEALSVRLCFAAALLTYAIAALNLLGPRECATQALTPACAARWADPGVNATMDAHMEAATFAGRDLRPNDPRADWVDRHPDLIDAYSEGQAYRYESECW